MRGKIIIAAAALALLSGCVAGPGKPSVLPAAGSAAPGSGGGGGSRHSVPKRPRTAEPSRSSQVPVPAPTGTDLQPAIATAEAYYAESNRAINTGDTSGLRALATTDCPCLATADYIEKTWRRGSIKAPDYYSITSLGTATINPDGITAVVNVFYNRGAERHYGKNGAQTSYAPPKRGLESVFLLREVAGVWKVYDLQRYT